MQLFFLQGSLLSLHRVVVCASDDKLSIAEEELWSSVEMAGESGIS